ncbi:MAG: DinB family protein [Gemmatimonadaceae bacterium]
MNQLDELRKFLVGLCDWREAHAGFDATVEGIAPELRGIRPDGLPYSAWELIEHMRLTQHDILDFCINDEYEELKWPDDYWPAASGPPTSEAWDESIADFRKDREALKRLAADPKCDLFAKVPPPRGTGQTYLREVVLVADHNAYHLGQLVMVRRLLGDWATK